MAKKIVIIEDEEFVASVLQKKLTREGYSVSVFLNGEEGFKKIKELQPDLILLDIAMPQVGGFRVMEMIIRDNQIKNKPVIMISNSGHQVEKERAQELGVKDLIIKTEFDLDDILKKVEQQIGK